MTDAEKEPILQGGGECGALLRGLDWACNPLGLPSGWPDELAVLVGMALVSAQPMLIVWGPQRITLYNDAYAAMCGQRHPAALGRPFRELWFDVWDRIEPIIAAAYDGISTSMEDIAFTLHRNGYPEKANFAFSYTPVRDRSGAVLGMFCPCTETTRAVALRDAQRVERSGFLQIFEVALGAVALLSGPDHIFRFANSDYLRLVGNRDVIGKPVRLALPEVVGQGFIDILDRVYRTGESHVGRHIPIALQSHPEATPRQHFLDFLYHPIRDDSGTINGIFVQAIDVTERVDEDQRRQMLLGELSHRMKNQLAMIQAIVNQTLRSADDLASATRVLSERIRVLSGAHDILIEGRTSSTTVEEIVQKVLVLHDHGGTRLRAEGPALAVAARPALSLSLILHELSTNAAKYGALSGDTGTVRIAWETARSARGTDRFVLTWTEEGGPPVCQPESFGSGSRLIEAGLSGTADCEVVTDYAPDGLRCTISADLLSFQTAD
ncbi:PAS domain-containing protein [Paracoccus sp. YIM 132242]|uniref:histidine kinase n=1 Tax=Paracoccus lichenicola TaxID=2665644 RepID=A0A6L6HNQ6_9RHOB|nr:PAS domain-containing protein [Paracoccus lichenicola]MTE00797.1 PAS domain-containing protein [Paracoccus lichenicola]